MFGGTWAKEGLLLEYIEPCFSPIKSHSLVVVLRPHHWPRRLAHLAGRASASARGNPGASPLRRRCAGAPQEILPTATATKTTELLQRWALRALEQFTAATPAAEQREGWVPKGGVMQSACGVRRMLEGVRK